MSARVVAGTMPVAFRYTPGVANTRFLETLRDRGAFLGSRCDGCSLTVVPTRLFCERCFEETAAEVECGPGGTLESWTVGHVGTDGEPLDEPVTLGLVRLDGADSLLVHRLLDVPDPEIGMRVRAVLAQERTAGILDVEGFASAVGES
jgi:uncharacterized OB-fold protein